MPSSQAATSSTAGPAHLRRRSIPQNIHPLELQQEDLGRSMWTETPSAPPSPRAEMVSFLASFPFSSFASSCRASSSVVDPIQRPAVSILQRRTCYIIGRTLLCFRQSSRRPGIAFRRFGDVVLREVQPQRVPGRPNGRVRVRQGFRPSARPRTERRAVGPVEAHHGARRVSGTGELVEQSRFLEHGVLGVACWRDCHAIWR